MSISASIVTYKTEPSELEKCVRALLDNGIAFIYIVDNSPTDELRSFCAEYPPIKYIFAGSNIGYGAGHNVAIRRVIEKGFTYHLVVNSDVYFERGVIDVVTDYMDKNPDVAECQPRVIYPTGRVQRCRQLPGPMNLIARRFMPKKIRDFMNRRYALPLESHEHEMNVAYLQGAFMLFRVSCFKEVGLFDERFFMYPEDIDITRRMHARYRTMYIPYTSIIHAHRRASYTSSRMLMIHMYNMAKYFNKWGWIFDRQRWHWNKQLLKEISAYESNPTPQ